MQGKGMRPENDAPKQIIVKRLHFSASQTKQYEELIKEHQIKVRAFNDSIAVIKNQLYGSLANDNFEAKDVLIAKLSNLQEQIELLHYNHFAAIRKICRADQIADFNALSKDLARFFFQPKSIDQDGPPPRE
ncbi:hypothetical protein ADIARSV_0930 [Arcticibacter svalbardensis MN12-7]|uniref:Uncharacterized protein n=2 Tax=Arcticibacter TaxID=1288026 RepID=R9GW18_9SPHI|nr:hypothetical protein ADIARSV_0930 [Arcticibacter svalbardensis MN12-7]